MSRQRYSTDWMLGRAETRCSVCEGTGRIAVACPDNKPGCIVAHYKRCECSKPAPTPQDAEAVARPDLTAETLAMLEAQRKVLAYTHEHWHQQDALLAHAAACVREVAALRARPALPADVQAVVERVSDALTIVHPIEDLARLHYDSPTHPTENVALYAPIAMEYVSVGDIRTLLAHFQRQDTP